MKRRTLIALSAVFVTVVAALLISSQTVLVSAQNHGHGKGDRDEPPPFYNPYPPGILPADLDSEIARVLREVDFIENEALMQLRALPPTLSRHQYVYRHVHGVQSRHRSKLFTVEARKRLPYPDSDAASALCIGHLRPGASAD